MSPGRWPDGDGVEVRGPHRCRRERLAHDGHDALDVRAACDLGDHAPVALVEVVLRRDDVGKDLAAVAHHRPPPSRRSSIRSRG
jgi:hypothetical protein